MSVCLYMGGLEIVKKSGVGQAILHQKKALGKVGVKVDGRMEADTRIIHINTVFPDSVFAALRARRRGIKVVYYAHSTMEDFRRSFQASNALAPLFKRWIRFCYGLGDVILTPTAYSRKILESYGLCQNIYSLSNGVDTEKFRPNLKRRAAFRCRYRLKEDDQAVISVGHTIERKGIFDYIALAERMPDVRFFWFGHTAPALLPRAVRKAMEHAPKNLTFAGYVAQEALRDAYCGADAFAFLSKEETEGIAVLEALSSGIPTLVRDIPVYEGWLAHGENVYQAEDVPAFACLLEGLLRKTLPDLSCAGRRIAQDRSLTCIGEKLLEIYQAEGFDA